MPKGLRRECKIGLRVESRRGIKVMFDPLGNAEKYREQLEQRGREFAQRGVSKVLEMQRRAEMACPTPGLKIRSKGKGGGLARGRGRGPIGIPFGYK